MMDYEGLIADLGSMAVRALVAPYGADLSEEDEMKVTAFAVAVVMFREELLKRK